MRYARKPFSIFYFWSDIRFPETLEQIMASSNFSVSTTLKLWHEIFPGGIKYRFRVSVLSRPCLLPYESLDILFNDCYSNSSQFTSVPRIHLYCETLSWKVAFHIHRAQLALTLWDLNSDPLLSLGSRHREWSLTGWGSLWCLLAFGVLSGFLDPLFFPALTLIPWTSSGCQGFIFARLQYGTLGESLCIDFLCSIMNSELCNTLLPRSFCASAVPQLSWVLCLGYQRLKCSLGLPHPPL